MKYLVFIGVLISSISHASYAKHRPHNLLIIAGLSPTKLHLSGNVVSQIHEPVYGLCYTYRFKHGTSLGVQGLSNNTGLVTLGFGF